MQLGITTVQCDRGPWIKEWIAFHYLVGFRKFYFFAHNCKDNTIEILTELKKNFDIKVFAVNSEVVPHIKSYQYSCDIFLGDVDWMAFLDGDEFLFPASNDSMEEALNLYSDKKLSALGVYWSCFGSSGHLEEPPGLIIENYKYRAKDDYHNNRHVKSIVRGRQAVIAPCSHILTTPLGTYDENLRSINNGRTDYEPTYKKFRINHYICQSRSYYLNFKRDRGNFDNGSEIRDETWWKEYDRNDVLDDSMNKFIKPLKNILSSI